MKFGNSSLLLERRIIVHLNSSALTDAAMRNSKYFLNYSPKISFHQSSTTKFNRYSFNKQIETLDQIGKRLPETHYPEPEIAAVTDRICRQALLNGDEVECRDALIKLVETERFDSLGDRLDKILLSSGYTQEKHMIGQSESLFYIPSEVWQRVLVFRFYEMPHRFPGTSFPAKNILSAVCDADMNELRKKSPPFIKCRGKEAMIVAICGGGKGSGQPSPLISSELIDLPIVEMDD